MQLVLLLGSVSFDTQSMMIDPYLGDILRPKVCTTGGREDARAFI